MKQIILDTETTGLKPELGHRIIEIGCIEFVERKPTGKTFHCYLNPGREVETGALAVHGISNEFLANKPTFAEIFESFFEFVKNAEIIAHNASFDLDFLRHEIKLLSLDPKIFTDQVTIFDTLSLARKMFPGQRNSLDALCKRFKIDCSERNLHGALLDATLLAKVYLCLTGGQTSLLAENENEANQTLINKIQKDSHEKTAARNHLPIIRANQVEMDAHEKFMAKIRKVLATGTKKS